MICSASSASVPILQQAKTHSYLRQTLKSIAQWLSQLIQYGIGPFAKPFAALSRPFAAEVNTRPYLQMSRR